MGTLRRILLVEDNAKDVELTLSVLEDCHLADSVVVARDGVEALDYLCARGRFAWPPGHPAVVLLDIKMPRLNGFEVLRQVKSDPGLKTIPVVMLTSSGENSDLLQSYELGANAYVIKPLGFEHLAAVLEATGTFWAAINEPFLQRPAALQPAL